MWCSRVVVFLFLYQYFSLVLTDKERRQRCLFLINTPMEYYCRGLYPQEISIKYRDEWIYIGEPFVIYRSTKSDSKYLIIFRYCALHECRLVTIRNNIYSLCVPLKSLTDEPIKVHLSNATGICHMYNLYFIDDMLRICAKQNNFKEKPKSSTESALIYYLGERTNAAITISNRILSILLLCALIALLAFC